MKGLKNKKAVGPDSIANEFLKSATDDLLNLILDFLNLNFEKGITSSNWCFDLISLVHKHGPKDDPNNYRGICIMNTLLKVLCTLLNDKLNKYCHEKQGNPLSSLLFSLYINDIFEFLKNDSSLTLDGQKYFNVCR